MKWNLRLAAANRGIWKASELQRMLAEARPGHQRREDVRAVVGQPGQRQARSDLDVICAVLGCGVEELLIPEPAADHPPGRTASTSQQVRRPPRRPGRR